MERINYKNKNERDNLIVQKITESKILVAEENHSDGDYLVFCDAAEIAAREAKEIKESLRAMTIEMVTLLKDIIDILKAKGVISLADIPQKSIDVYQKISNLQNKIK